ncbi:hypothetical protein JAAARDRAFT_78268 [Jaapia argillacea MUCL 33604]|uniref:DUF6534 domain-containing protein n=1 Tax=Jaapia argillacea MUCL 33604 TaxID=933084 RepID=A0A067PUT6_9AGAM|nr:hypothetical protein JAAARDRAFT_78268 [Jaapia argillacea MUCL 33604]
MSSILSQIQEHPGSFLGAYLADLVLQAFQTGLLVDLSLKFWRRSHNESVGTRVLVAYVMFVALFQMGISFYSTWRVSVVHFGDWVGFICSLMIWVDDEYRPHLKFQMVLITLVWPDKLQGLMTVALSSPVQAFLIWRCWILTRKSWVVLIPLVSMLLASVISALYVSVGIFTIWFPTHGPPMTSIPVNTPFVLSLILTAALDFAITTTLLFFLSRSRSDVYSRRFDRVFQRLIMLSWEAAVAPCGCAIIAAVFYVVYGNDNFWYLFFRAILGKLYAMSLLITLNSRAKLRRKLRSSVVDPTLNLHPIEVHVTGSGREADDTTGADSGSSATSTPPLEIVVHPEVTEKR